MTTVDWIIIAGYFAFSIAIGLMFSKRAGKSTQEFFLSGRNLPWWLAGLSMVATTFAADTPLAVTELVASRGIGGNWLWWNMVIGGMLTVFFFARLWRRSGVMTDLEFIEKRYDGKPAAFLRGFRAIYLGLFMNAIIMGWVNVAMGSILEGMFGIPASEVFWYIAAAMLFTALYSSLSGLWGVTVTDAFQFVIAMTGCVVLAILVLQSPEIGGLDGLRNALPAESLSFFPKITSATEGITGVLALSAGAFFAYIGVQWWASWYPGAEPGGGGYIAQRMLSTKNEKHAVYSVLFFQVAHYCLRPWPWIIVGFASLVLYPDLTDKKLGFIYAMNDFLPAGLKGLLLAAFFAAYMSTIATHLNWGTSYLINDLWRRFIRVDASEKQYVSAGRLITVALMVLSLALTTMIDSISGAWQFLIECGAGLGLVLILRWYWWRINAWSEIIATVTPIVVYALIVLYNHLNPSSALVFPDTLFIIVTATTISWLTGTFLTKPVALAKLIAFYRVSKPGGKGWLHVARHCPDVRTGAPFGRLFLAWLFGCVFVYSVLFASGAFLFHTASEGLLWSVVAFFAGTALGYILRAMRTEDSVDILL